MGEADVPINLMTVEDPVEYKSESISQIQVNEKVGLTFAAALRSILRQDPDIIMIGEIRDMETAEMAIQAALTGHLVLSTLHTNDAASAINRLLDLGVNTSILASSLTLIVAQRLIRKVCSQCSEMAALAEDMQEPFIKKDLAPPEMVLKAVGCESCYNSGYAGRTGIYEVIKVDKEIEQLIFSGALKSTIEDAAIKAGTSLMFRQALRKVIDRITSMEEVYRVVADA